jgi:hypothetical protein
MKGREADLPVMDFFFSIGVFLAGLVVRKELNANLCVSLCYYVG